MVFVLCSVIADTLQSFQNWWNITIPEGAYEIADVEVYLSRLSVSLNRMVSTSTIMSWAHALYCYIHTAIHLHQRS